MVKCPTGGRKKKLNASAATNDMKTATVSPQFADTISTARRKLNATVVGFTWTTRVYKATMIPTMATVTANLNTLCGTVFTFRDFS